MADASEKVTAGSRSWKDKAEDKLQDWNEGGVAAGVAHAATDSSRIVEWAAQSILSAINVGSHVSALNRRCVPNDFGGCDDYNWSNSDKWTTAATSTSLGLSLIMVILHYCCVKHLGHKIMNHLPEGIVATIVLGFVASGMPGIMDPANDQAINEEGEIINANLYFFSWASLAVAVHVFCSWVFEARHKNLSLGVIKSKWYLLLAAAVVVTSSSTRLFKTSACSDGEDSKYCTRLKYAIAAGAIGTFFALVASVMSFVGRLSLYPEAALSLIIFLFGVFAVAFVTFGGDNAPAQTVGNLYFSTWISFVLATFLALHCFKEWKARNQSDEQEDDDEVPAEDDKEENVEAEDDKKENVEAEDEKEGAVL